MLVGVLLLVILRYVRACLICDCLYDHVGVCYYLIPFWEQHHVICDVFIVQ